MTGNFYFNKETTKLELHFEKSDYDALPTELKTEIKHTFLWSRESGCWISRAKEPHLYTAKQIAKGLGLEDGGSLGERISFAEQIERKQDRATARAERYEDYASNADIRAEIMQSDINHMRGDTAFFTQPNINTAAGQAFTRRREKMFERYRNSFDEYKKSEYFRNRAATASITAEMPELKNRGFLDRRIRECQKNIRGREKNVIYYETRLYQIEQGVEPHDYLGNPITAEEISAALERELELIEVEMDKQAFYENKLDELGGIKFSKENIKPGYIVKLSKWKNLVNVVSTGPKNITYSDSIVPYTLKAAYAEIEEVIKGD